PARRSRARGAGRGSAVADRELDRGGPGADGHARRRSWGVLDHVGQGLLDDAKRRQVNALRQWAGIALDRELDRQAGRARALEQAVELPEPRLRSALCAVVVASAQEFERAVHL